MPELPEVETCCQYLNKHITNKKIIRTEILCSKLRWPVSKTLPSLLKNKSILTIKRRAKYLLCEFPYGTLIIHLGMSGHLRFFSDQQTLRKHDHVVLYFSDQSMLCFNDPRRFGCVLWTEEPYQHKILSNLGYEPLESDFNSKILYQMCKNSKRTIKNIIMDAQHVVGIGNIYANESLFDAGIRPDRIANTIIQDECSILCKSIKHILKLAIRYGGTTLKNFKNGDGQSGCFTQQLAVYGRGFQPCIKCHTPLIQIQQQQRQTIFCKKCQL